MGRLFRRPFKAEGVIISPIMGPMMDRNPMQPGTAMTATIARALSRLPSFAALAAGVAVLVMVLSSMAALSPAVAADHLKPAKPHWKPGQVFKDCPTCPELVVVPAGIFIMGVSGKRKTEKPAHRVNFAKAFAMGRFELTFDEWLVCADDGGCQHRPDDHKWGRKGRPVINVTYFDAKEYLAWISKKTGHVYRLPTEAEWEYADRGGTTTQWWWGNKVGKNNANCKDCKSKWSDGGTEPHGSAPVGSFKSNPFGLYDTSANLFEWVEDCWNKTHLGAPSDGSARTKGNCRYRVIRGGSFYYFSKVARSAYRAKNPPGVKSYWLGFRVLRELG